MDIQLTIAGKEQTTPLTFSFSKMINAGFVGRDQEEVQRHLQELSQKGIPCPSQTPVLYPVVCRALTTETSIEVYGRKTSGEVEYILYITNEQEIYVGIGSDHTDRHLEEFNIPRSKQICPNLSSQQVWPLEDIEAHWDELTMKSMVTANGRDILYQEGKLELILSPRQLMDIVRANISGPLENMVIYSGTVGMLTEGFTFGERFTATLNDPVLDRRLEISYDIQVLDYLAMEGE